jgi:drug/metabolite transporter (DMT)-like permease
MQTMFVFSLSNTTVANTAFILTSGPILTAALAHMVLGERVRRGTWVVLFVALSGIGLMVGDGLVTGNVLGDLAAVATAFSFACFVVTLRARRRVDMVPSVVTGAAMATVVAFLAADANLSVTGHDAGLAVFWGGGLSALVLLLFTMASRHLTGVVLTILLMVEYCLGPFWVWLFIGETPSELALIGGAIVLSAVVGQAYLSALEPQRKRAG